MQGCGRCPKSRSTRKPKYQQMQTPQQRKRAAQAEHRAFAGRERKLQNGTPSSSFDCGLRHSREVSGDSRAHPKHHQPHLENASVRQQRAKQHSRLDFPTATGASRAERRFGTPPQRGRRHATRSKDARSGASFGYGSRGDFGDLRVKDSLLAASVFASFRDPSTAAVKHNLAAKMVG